MATCGSAPQESVVFNATCDANNLTPEAFVNCILNASQENALRWSDAAESAALAAACTAIGLDVSTTREEQQWEVTAEEPEIPDDLDNVVSQYLALQDTMIPIFAQNLDDYFDRENAKIYHPSYIAAANWMADVITNGASGIPVDLEMAIYGRATDRIKAEQALALQESSNQSGVLGWDMPQPFIQAHGVSRVLSLNRVLGEESTRIAEKQIDIQVAQIRFAVEEANKVYLGMERNGVAYMQAWVSMLNQLKDLSTVDPNVRATYINAVANLYGQRIKKDQVQWMSLNDYYQRIQGDNKLDSSNKLEQTGLVVQANAIGAEVMKMLAAASLSQLSTMVTKVATS